MESGAPHGLPCLPRGRKINAMRKALHPPLIRRVSAGVHDPAIVHMLRAAKSSELWLELEEADASDSSPEAREDPARARPPEDEMAYAGVPDPARCFRIGACYDIDEHTWSNDHFLLRHSKGEVYPDPTLVAEEIAGLAIAFRTTAADLLIAQYAKYTGLSDRIAEQEGLTAAGEMGEPEPWDAPTYRIASVHEEIRMLLALRGEIIAGTFDGHPPCNAFYGMDLLDRILPPFKPGHATEH